MLCTRICATCDCHCDTAGRSRAVTGEVSGIRDFVIASSALKINARVSQVGLFSLVVLNFVLVSLVFPIYAYALQH